MSTLALPELVAVARASQAGSALRGHHLRCSHNQEPQASGQQRRQSGQLTHRVRQLAHGTGLPLLLSGTALEARQAGACGLHRGAAELARLTARPPTPLWAVSAHSAGELARAAALGADLALVSPVLPAAAHHTQPALGWHGLRALAAGSPLPLYAQGGMCLADIGTARDSGALGVALDVSRLSGPDAPATTRPQSSGTDWS